jgi:hypothetical protein
VYALPWNCAIERREARGVFDGALPSGAAGLLGSHRFVRECLRDHRVDLGSVDVPVQCPHDADARKHRRTVERRDQDQGFHCSLPFRRCVFDLRKSCNVVAGVLKRDQRATAGQGDWLIKDARPSQSIHFRRSRRMALAGRILSWQPLPATIAAHPRADLTASSR